jgi:hypothetical protein
MTITENERLLWELHEQTEYLRKIRGMLIGIVFLLAIPLVLGLVFVLQP